ncbi:AraC family transcriptional regulator [Desulforamulus ruminis]|uniref:helix-turn-helix domain-containing protein n=1 Tax=Desulforamulus ruminis TaxID=1564 RepID=UPI002FD90BB4
MEGSMAKQYEVNSLTPDISCVCEGFNRAYNEGCGGYSFHIPQELGSGHLKQLSGGRNARVMDFDIRLARQVELNGVSRVPHLDMLFCLGDDIYWELPQTGKEFAMLSGEGYVGTCRETMKRCVYPARCDIHLIEIKMPLNKIKDFLGEIQVGCHFYCHSSVMEPFGKFKITPSIHVILQQMLKCPYQASLKRLYMEGKLLELVAVYLNETVYQTAKIPESLPLSSDDVKSLYRAKEILDENLAQPLPLSRLAKRVCLNEYKLKKGFKELFGVPVYTYVLDQRLELARLLLEEKKLRVSDVAGLVGYGNMSHFAAAFRKKYGINPGDYLKNVSK